MKDLKTYIELRYITEAIKPPRLSAKNREIWKNGIVNEEKIMKWLKENCWVEGKVEIVRGKINVDGDVIINDDAEEFLYPFGEVTGYFECSECIELKSLKNSPRKVGRDFSCSGCYNLTSLEGAPKEVSKDFYCYGCGKEFTEDDVKKVCHVKGKIYV